MPALIGAVPLAALIVGFIFVMITLRRVVPTNEVHIIQSTRKTMSYGKDSTNGNVYYQYPAWVPKLGVNKTVLPVSVFKLELESYDAYDKDRLPFEIDLVAFFRITESNMAAQRVSHFKELQEQLIFILKGAARTILASYDINEIMVERSKFGDHFTREVEGQLANWGVATVKNIELMDIRDSNGSHVIQNIMAKTKSLIEMESRTEVAKNMQAAEIAEISSKKNVELEKQTSAQAIGQRDAQRQMEVGISTQKAAQSVKEQEVITREQDMAIIKVQQVRQAEIDKEVTMVKAEQTKQAQIITSEGLLQSKRLEAEGITVNGQARAEAEKAMQLAPVQAQIELAKEIGANDSYQKYLITIRRIEAEQNIGIKQAEALKEASIKVIANTGDPVSGVRSVMDLFSAKGGTQIGAMLEAVAQTDKGSALLNKLNMGGKDE